MDMQSAQARRHPVTLTTPADPRPADRRPIGFWLKLVDRLIDEGFDAVLGEAGLTRRHWQVLHLLQAEPATVQRTDTLLAPFLSGGAATTRPVFDDLQGRGWVTWTDDQHATLTETGASAHAELLGHVSHSRERLSAGITPQEYAATIEILRRMAVNLGWAESL
jgi:DNA-binding MarR family transcriptional regulator